MSSGLRTPSGLSLPTPLPLRAALKIHAVGGPHDGESWDIDKPRISVGRMPTNDISLERDSKVSRNHILLGFRDGRWFVQDQGSSNGTYLCMAGQLCRISTVFELPGDARIRVGNTELKIQFVQ